MVILLQMLAGGWAPGGGVEDIIYGVEVVFHPYTLLNNQLFIESGWIYVMNDVEAQEFGL